MTVASLGLGREGINRLIWLEASKVDDQAKMVCPRRISTTKEYEKMKQYIGYGPAAITPEGARVTYDSLGVLHERDFRPVKRTKGVKISMEALLTDQYKILARKIPEFSKSFMHSRNQAAANLHVLGFTDTGMGMNSETLYSTSHDLGGGYTFANRPATDYAFGPIGVQQMSSDIRRQKQGRNLPGPYTGKIRVLVPPELEGNLWVVQNSMSLPGSADNDANYSRTRIVGAVCDYFTSATAWFGVAVDQERHGLFELMLKTYAYLKLPPQDDMMDRHIAYEMYTHGWFDAHGTWGTTG